MKMTLPLAVVFALLLTALPVAAEPPASTPPKVGYGADGAAVGEAIPYQTVPYDKASPEKMKWWEDAKFGLFVHWGVYSVPGGIWSKDHTFKTWLEGNPTNLYCPHNYAEQIVKWGEMTFPEYERFLPYFDWSKFNAQDFINLCFASGQHYIVITSKHMDGLSLIHI